VSTYDESHTYEMAARPAAEPLEITFGELRAGDYMTNDNKRWVKVVKTESGPRGNRHVADTVSILFEIPEPVNMRSMETRYWIDRGVSDPVIVDGSTRGEG
jgi:hypothetical protein